MIRLTLVGKAPLINQAYKRGRNSFYKDKEVAARQEIYAWQARSQYKGPILTGKLALTMDFYHRNPLVDIDSGEKLTQDALHGIVFANDNQIKDKRTRVFIDKNRERCELTITEVA